MVQGLACHYMSYSQYYGCEGHTIVFIEDLCPVGLPAVLTGAHLDFSQFGRSNLSLQAHWSYAPLCPQMLYAVSRIFKRLASI